MKKTEEIKLFVKKSQMKKDAFYKSIAGKYTPFASAQQQNVSLMHKKDNGLYEMILELLYQMRSLKYTNQYVFQSTMLKQQIQSILQTTVVFGEMHFLKELLYENKKWDAVFLEKVIYEIESNIKKNKKKYKKKKKKKKKTKKTIAHKKML